MEYISFWDCASGFDFKALGADEMDCTFIFCPVFETGLGV